LENNLFNLKSYNDEDCSCGSLIFLQKGSGIPFEMKRIFYIYDVDLKQIRGEHAHYNSNQLLICIHGSCDITLDNGTNKTTYRLNSPTKALLQKPFIWGKMTNFTKGSILLCISDSLYDTDDYIRDYEKFLKLIDENKD